MVWFQIIQNRMIMITGLICVIPLIAVCRCDIIPNQKNSTTALKLQEVKCMEIIFRQAKKKDAALLVDIYNSSFYSDYIKYGECPAYGQTKEMMEQSIIDYPKFVILCDSKPVGCISCKEMQKGIYEVGCLCVIPEFQGKGIGTKAFEFVKSHYDDWEKFTLITPADKNENIRFYTEKCGFYIASAEMDGNVKVVRFVLKR